MVHRGIHVDVLHNSRHFENRTRSPGSSRLNNSNNINSKLSSDCFRNLGPVIKLCLLNIKGTSKDKCHYLSKLTLSHAIGVTTLQETHSTTKDQLFARGTIASYTLVSYICNSLYGSAAYVRNN
ncbi:hypothetical protein BDFB_013969 [Asbolus verrucosus]|uniref:Uncharacterized protein n=1 Tax=Asbolus verrucosus TaxID=1661398 RepID=A0A482VHP8_ASBVE|nr:hypothetical protein BDFB_013969 [Asbolus verrucosus]